MTKRYHLNRLSLSTTGIWWLVFAVFALLYWLTCQHGVSWQDSGMFQWRVLISDYEGQVGLALSHPLYIMAGRLLLYIPLGEFSERFNFFSGLGMAIALANVAVINTLLTGRPWIGLATAAMLGVTHTVWWLSTITEVYTWDVAFLTVELWLLVTLLRQPKWQTLAVLAFVSGLGWNVHNLELLPLPIYAAVTLLLVKRRQLPLWSPLLAIGAYISGASLFIGLIIKMALERGDMIGALSSALFGYRWMPEVLRTTVEGEYLMVNLALGSLNFVNLLGPLAILGLISLRRRLGNTLAMGLWLLTAIEIIFVIRYFVPDQFTFLLPTLVMLTIAAAVGLAVLADASPRWRQVAVTGCILSIMLPPAIYAAAPSLLRTAGVDVRRARELAFRDEMRYWLVPWKFDEHSAELFAAAALQQTPSDGIILADDASIHPLLLIQRRNHLSPQVVIQDIGVLSEYEENRAAFLSVLSHHPLYIVSPIYLSTALLEDVEVVREGVLYRVRSKSTVTLPELSVTK